MKKFFESNLFYGIVAVGMAVFLLLYVASAENPVVDKPFPNVSVAVNGLAEGYLLEAEPRPVEIRVSGYRSALNLTSARDVKAYVDLSGAKPGTASYPIDYTIPGGLSIVYVRPESVELSIDVFETRELQIVPLVSNSVKQGYNSTAPTVTPPVVTVSGPKRALDEITEAVIVIDLAGRANDLSGALPVILHDKGGAEITDRRINLSDKEVSVYVGISENLSSKSVSIRTPLSGSVGERYIMTGIDFKPSTVKISGSYAVVSTIEYLNTEPINLSSLTDTFHSSVKLVTPPGVTVLEGDEVEITIRIEKNLVTRTFVGIPIEIRNAPEDIDYKAIPETVDVTLAAFPDVFEKALVNGEVIVKINAYVNLVGLEEFTGVAVDQPVIIEVPDDYAVAHISAETIKVTDIISEDE